MLQDYFVQFLFEFSIGRSRRRFSVQFMCIVFIEWELMKNSWMPRKDFRGINMVEIGGKGGGHEEVLGINL